jgi:hypothetical protein
MVVPVARQHSPKTPAAVMAVAFLLAAFMVVQALVDILAMVEAGALAALIMGLPALVAVAVAVAAMPVGVV